MKYDKSWNDTLKWHICFEASDHANVITQPRGRHRPRRVIGEPGGADRLIDWRPDMMTSWARCLACWNQLQSWPHTDWPAWPKRMSAGRGKTLWWIHLGVSEVRFLRSIQIQHPKKKNRVQKDFFVRPGSTLSRCPGKQTHSSSLDNWAKLIWVGCYTSEKIQKYRWTSLTQSTAKLDVVTWHQALTQNFFEHQSKTWPPKVTSLEVYLFPSGTSYPFSLCTRRLDAANFIIIPAPQHGFVGEVCSGSVCQIVSK